MLLDSKAVEKVAALKEQDAGLVEKIKQFLTNIIAKIKKAYAGYGIDRSSDEAQAVDRMTDVLEELRALFEDAAVDAAKNYQSAAQNNTEKTRKTLPETVKKQAKDSEFDKPITLEDIHSLRSIGRKSINRFEDEDLQKAQKWAYKFYKELGTKSPFFRAWFGDWRAYDKTPIKAVEVDTVDIDVGQIHSERGTFSNADTGWSIVSGSLAEDETKHYAHGDRDSVKMLTALRKIMQSAVLLDTEVSAKKTSKKHINTVFMHKMYAPVLYDGKEYIARINVEEYFEQGNSRRRVYHLEGIKIEPTANGFADKISLSNLADIGSIHSIADLFAFVKRYDSKFEPKAVGKTFLNDDGTPKVLYHGSKNGGGFSEFKNWQYFTENKNYAMRYTQRENKESLYEVYVKMEKPFDTRKAECKKIFEKMRQEYGLSELQDTGLPDWTDGYDISDFIEENDFDYDGIILDEGGDLVDGKSVSRGESYVVRDSSQVKSVGNIGTFDKGKNIKHQKKQQLEIINETNPAPNTYSTWIRTEGDIKTLAETLEDSDWVDGDEFNPDLTREDIQNAIRKGTITVYSSYPIKDGVFVSPSYMEAESYSPDGRVYRKTVDIRDVAWIDPTQGQYARVSDASLDVDYGMNKKVKMKQIEINKGISKPVQNQAKNSYSEYGANFYKDSEIYSYDFLASRDPMKVLTAPKKEEVFTNGKIDREKVLITGKKKALALEGSSLGKDGAVSVVNRYTKKSIAISEQSIKHGLGGKQSYFLTNARLGMIIGEIVQNGIPLNELTPSNGAESTYAIGAYVTSPEGREFLAIAHIDVSSNNLISLGTEDLVHSLRGRIKKGSPVAIKSAPALELTSSTVVASDISIAQFLEFVNSTNQSLLSDDVLKHFEEIRKPEGTYYGKVKHQLKEPTHRTILANALETTIDTSTPEGKYQLQYLTEYKGHIAEIEDLEAHLAEVKTELKELSLEKGKRDKDKRDKIDKLLRDKNRTQTKLNRLDRRLTELDSMKPIRDLLAREMTYEAHVGIGLNMSKNQTEIEQIFCFSK